MGGREEREGERGREREDARGSRPIDSIEMHPPLVLHRNPQCREQILALQRCHKEHSLSKFWGACNDVKIKLDACFRKQKEYKSKVNLTKARAERERLEERRRRASGGE